MRVILTGGGTGGHFFPLIALGQNLIARHIEVLILGRKHSWEEKNCLKLSLPFKGITTGRRIGKFSLQNVQAMLKLGKGFFETLKIFRDFSPEVIVATGGYVSLPVMLAGFFSGCPLLIHEQNILPGLANRIFAPAAREISLSFGKTGEYFPKRFKNKLFITGCPLRKTVELAEARGLNQEPFLLLEENKFTLLVMGGSQGAHRLNDLVLQAQKIWQKENSPIQVIHLTGEKDRVFIKEAYARLGIKSLVFPFYYDMGAIYSIADVALVRGGAGTLAELALWGIPAIIIPYPYAAGRHQEFNARFFAQEGAAEVYRQADLNPLILSQAVVSLVKDEKKLRQMAQASRNLGKKEAADLLVERIIRLAASSKPGS